MSERHEVNVLFCAWLLGRHQWRLLARWSWEQQRRTIIGERCARCGLHRPVGGYFGALRADVTRIA